MKSQEVSGSFWDPSPSEQRPTLGPFAFEDESAMMRDAATVLVRPDRRGCLSWRLVPPRRC